MSEFEDLILENEEYFLNLPYHLAEADMADDLCDILTEFEFIEYKVSVSLLQPLIEDYDFALQSDVQIYQDKKNSLRLIKSAIRLSTNVLAEDKTQLAEQLMGRLLYDQAPTIQTLLEEALRSKRGCWFRSLAPSLAQAGEPVLRTLEEHRDSVYGVAIISDGMQALSVSSDRTLKLWDLQTGECQKSLEGHHDMVTSVAITPHNKQALSASWDRTLKLWDLQTGECLSVWFGESPLNCCAISSDGVTVVVGEYSGRVHILRLEGMK